jgi:hypothetical protein
MTQIPRVAILEKQGGVLSWHTDLADGFRACGAEARTVQIRPVSMAEHREKWRAKTPAWSNPAIVRRVAAELKTLQPNLVVLLKQPGLPAETAAAWRAVLPASTPLVGWICDHLLSLPAGWAACLDGVYYFDSFTRPVLDHAYAGRPGVRLAHLPLAADPKRFVARAKPFEQRIPRLVFAGTHSPDRNRAIADYRAAGGKVDSYGPGARVGARVWRRARLSATDLAGLFGSYFASLNLLQSPNTVHGLNLRAYEIAAAEGLGVYPDVPDLASLFEPDREIIAYRDLADLKTRMDALLAEPERAARIARAGRARLLGKHTYAHRARRMLDDWAA